MTILIRRAKKTDVDDIVSADYEWNTFVVEDEDFETVSLLNPWCIEPNQIAEWNKLKKNIFVMAIETFVQTVVKGEQQNIRWVCGGFSYEKTEEGYVVIWFATHPKASPTDSIAAIATYMKDLATDNDTVVFHIRDREEARLRLVLPILQKSGFAVSLLPDYFEDSIDGWKCTFGPKVPVAAKKT